MSSLIGVERKIKNGLSDFLFCLSKKSQRCTEL